MGKLENSGSESRFVGKWREASKEYEMNFKGIVEANVAALEGCAFMVPDFSGNLDKIWYGLRFLLYVVGTYGSQLTSEIINLHYLTGAISEIAAASFLFLTHAVQIPKVVYLFKNIDRVKNLIKSINCKEFQPQSEHQQETLKFYIRVSRIITFSFWGACVATCTFWAIYPFTEDELRLPLAGWFPFNITRSPNFEYAFIYQSVAATLNGLSNISIDTLMSGLIMVICAQLDILNDSLINIRHFAELELKHEFKSDNRNKIAPRLQDAMNRKLVECIIHHNRILEFTREFQDLFANSILGQFVVSVIIICITLFEMTLTPVGSLKFFSMVLYQYCMLLEIFLWCYFGNEVIINSSMLTGSAYQSAWVDCGSTEFKKKLIFFMTSSQKGTTISAGRLFSLSLSTFVTILKSSWSYFAVLMNIDK